MKHFKIPLTMIVLMALFIGSGAFLQSCSPNNDIQPITYRQMVTVKVRNVDGNLSLKHLRIVCDPASAGIVLDTNIVGNFTYSFQAKSRDISVTTSLTSNVLFISSLEIDANDKMQAYHNGSCSIHEISITNNMAF
jgi:hypothetical protein